MEVCKLGTEIAHELTRFMKTDPIDGRIERSLAKISLLAKEIRLQRRMSAPPDEIQKKLDTLLRQCLKAKRLMGAFHEIES